MSIERGRLRKASDIMLTKRSKIQKRIFLHVVVVIIITLFISVIAMASLVLNEYLQREVDNSIDKALKTKQNIEYIFRSANEMTIALATDREVKKRIMDWNNGNMSSQDEQNLDDYFKFLVDKLDSYESITIFGLANDIPEWNLLISSGTEDGSFLLQQVNIMTEKILLEEYFISSSAPNHWIYRNIKDDDKNIIGVVVVELNSSTIREVFASSSYEYQNEKIAIVDEIGDVILSFPNNTDFKSIFKENNDIIQYNTQVINRKVFGKRSILVSNTINYTDWQIVRIINMDSIYQVIFSTLQIALIMLLILIIIAVISSYAVSKTITEPILKLRKSVIDFEKADYKLEIISESDDEIGELAETFNDIGSRLRDSVDKIVENEKKKVEFQLQILEAQINPHFLYNTLDSIRWMAIINQQPQISEMVIAIIKLLRYNISDVDCYIALEDEIDCIKNYLSIQSYRYGKSVDIEYDIDKVKHLKVVKFLLQPLVENSIYHGSGNFKHDIIIKVIGYTNEDKLILKIIDNGIGIHKDIIKNNEITSKMHTGIGVENIKKRIKLYFGNQYDLKLIELEQGVEVQLTLPIIED